MPRIFLPFTETSGAIQITGEKAKYLATVLRCKEGEELVVFDGKGASLKTIIRRITKKDILAEIVEAIEGDLKTPLPVTLIQGLLKGEKMDLVIQKTTELGIRKIVPVITERSQLRETRKLDRWKKIAEEAARQCGRNDIPDISELLAFNEIFTEKTSPDTLSLLFWEGGGLPLKEAVLTQSPSQAPASALQPINILIGPEGGFSAKEVELAKANGCIVTSLGERILRAETAAISAVTLVQFLVGELG